MSNYLGELVEIIGGGTPSKSNPEFWSGKIPWASVKDFKTTELLSTADYITEAGVKGSATNVIPAGNIIVPTRMALGKVAVNKVDMAINQDLKALIVRDDEVLSKLYLLRFLESKAKYIEEQGKGATVKGITLDVLRGLEIPLPPLPEQKRIAAILDKADAIRRKRQQAIQLADEFLRAVFLDMFGDPVTNPKRWDETELLNVSVGKFQNGAYFPKEKYTEDGVEMVHMANAFYDVIQRGSLKRVDASKLDIDKYGLSESDIMISRRSLTYEGAAKPCLIPKSDEPLLFESSMIRFTPNVSKVNKRYLFQYLSEPLVKDHFIRKYVTGATIKGISQKNLEKVRVLVPPIWIQNEFSKKVNSIESLIAKLSSQNELSEVAFKALSQKAFSGEL
ncbi:MAG: restriction endonuclease subunit S [Ketobacter sp.]|nr:MAG: restriction endonuclease subunit S [Ketobacter sp.]